MFIRITGVKKQVLSALCLYVGQMMLGCYIAWTGTIASTLKDPEHSPITYTLTETQLSLVATSVTLGSIPSPYVSGWLSNTVGRKPCIVGGAFLSVIGSYVLSIATNLAMIFCSRLLLGFSAGVLSLMVIVYIGEIASKNIRGTLLVSVGISQTLGMILLYTVGSFLSYFWTTFFTFAVNIFFAIGTTMIPESPIFYIIKGNDEKAKNVLLDIGRSEDIEKLLSVKPEYMTTTNTKQWLEIFTIRCNRRAFFIAAIIKIFQTCSGLFVIVFFSESIFAMAGSSINSNTSMIVIGCFQLIGCTASSILVERAGRRIMLLISTFICTLSMFLLGLYFYLNSVDSSLLDSYKWFPLVVLIVFFVSHDFGFGVVPRVIIGEMFTSNVRSTGSALIMSLSWTIAFFVSTGAGILLEIVGGHVTFWFFTCVDACAFVFTLFFVIETKGKSLLEIQELLSK